MIFARSLAKKTVLLSDGTVVGTVYNITADLKTGSLLEILVRPQSNIPELEKENGLYIIPFETVKSIADYIVIDRRMLRKA
ncbi:MAG TPA: PRC-barrel domain containing protein [Archaeoglobus veneficus]|nr:MAG: PRC-barrel domain containing protein [Archaeoglobales archaeon]HDM60179.1 PRC-barrel domain containing protein [Archaeoglobus veneficus]